MHNEGRAGTYLLPALIIILAVILLDQYSKWFVMETMLRMEGKPNFDFLSWFMTQKKIAMFVTEREHFKTVLMSPLLNFTMVWNQGVSFGLMNSTSPDVAFAIIALSLLLVGGMLLWLVLNTCKLTAIAIGFVAGGAISNIIDRVRFDAVADFIDFHLNDRHWPAFNLADSSIVFGAFLLIVGSSFTSQNQKEKNHAAHH